MSGRAHSFARPFPLLGRSAIPLLPAKPDERLRDVHAPIGLDLGGRTPAEVALAVLSEMSVERFGGSGRPLRLAEEVYERAVAGTGGNAKTNVGQRSERSS